MRLLLSVAASALFAMPALAQTTLPAMPFPLAIPPALTALIAGPSDGLAQAAPPPAPTVVSPATPATVPVLTPTTKPQTHPRESQHARFVNANTTHDGHLTLAQAKIGYPSIVRHFDEIDAAKQGYITEDQIQAWEKAQRERRAAMRQAAASTTKQ